MKTLALSMLVLAATASAAYADASSANTYNVNVSCALDEPVMTGTLQMPSISDMTCVSPSSTDEGVYAGINIKEPIVLAFNGRIFNLILDPQSGNVPGTAIYFSGQGCAMSQVSMITGDYDGNVGAYMTEQLTGQSLGLTIESIGNGFEGSIGPCFFKTQ